MLFNVCLKDLTFEKKVNHPNDLFKSNWYFFVFNLVHVFQFFPIWSNLVKSGQIWSKSGQNMVWPDFDQIWPDSFFGYCFVNNPKCHESFRLKLENRPVPICFPWGKQWKPIPCKKGKEVQWKQSLAKRLRQRPKPLAKSLGVDWKNP